MQCPILRPPISNQDDRPETTDLAAPVGLGSRVRTGWAEPKRARVVGDLSDVLCSTHVTSRATGSITAVDPPDNGARPLLVPVSLQPNRARPKGRNLRSSSGDLVPLLTHTVASLLETFFILQTIRTLLYVPYG